jgi:L-2-hydroxyglutarate oxidase LhgO
MERTDAVVAGAGAVGLAVGRALAMTGREVMVLESESAIGTATSSRNSEVIHAGIYYPPEMLKTCLCVEGRVALYRYCKDRGIEHSKLGKLILAAGEDEIPRLRSLQARASRNGVQLEWLDKQAVAELEPDVRCVAALWSPETGILDSHGLMLALQGDLEAAGGMLLCNSPVDCVDRSDSSFEVEIGPDGDRLACNTFVNSAGLQAQALAGRMPFLPPEMIPAGRLVKGHYFYLSGPRPFNHLVYPLPTEKGLGVHVTLDIGGQVRFGPDAVPVDRVDYEFDEGRAGVFRDAIEDYYPDIRTRELRPGYTGIRPQLAGPQGRKQDFVIQGPKGHGVAGLVNLFGIESPGLTAVLAIADHVVANLDKGWVIQGG